MLWKRHFNKKKENKNKKEQAYFFIAPIPNRMIATNTNTVSTKCVVPMSIIPRPKCTVVYNRAPIPYKTNPHIHFALPFTL